MLRKKKKATRAGMCNLPLFYIKDRLEFSFRLLERSRNGGRIITRINVINIC